jgi:hypothetical protein
VNSTGITASDSGGHPAAVAGRDTRAVHRRGQAEQCPRGDELTSGARVGAGQRGRAEHDQCAGQQPLAAEPVPEQAGREQCCGQHQAVGVDEPLQIAGRGMQVGGERGQRQVEHCQVEPDHENAQRQRAECPPAASLSTAHDSHLLSTVALK